MDHPDHFEQNTLQNEVGGGGWNIPPHDVTPAGLEGCVLHLYLYRMPFYLELPVFGLRLVGGRSSFFFSRGGVVHGKVLKFQSNRCSNFEENGRSRAPILHFLAPLLASRDPVGIQSGTNVGRQPNSLKTHHFCRVWARILKKYHSSYLYFSFFELKQSHLYPQKNVETWLAPKTAGFRPSSFAQNQWF